MKNTVYAVFAASLAMFATSGIVALATAAPTASLAAPAAVTQQADAELVAHLDGLIAAQVGQIKGRLGLAPQ